MRLPEYYALASMFDVIIVSRASSLGLASRWTIHKKQTALPIVIIHSQQIPDAIQLLYLKMTHNLASRTGRRFLCRCKDSQPE